MGIHEAIKDITAEASAVANLIENLRQMNLLTEENLALAIESETSLREVVEKLLDDEHEADADIDKMKSRIGDLQARKKMYEVRKETIRSIIAVALGQSGANSLRTAFGTVTIKAGVPELIVTNEAEIPVEYFEQPDPVIDKKALGAAVRNVELKRMEALQIVEDTFEAERAFLNEIPDEAERAEALAIKEELHKATVLEVWKRYPAVPGATIGESKTVITIRRK